MPAFPGYLDRYRSLSSLGQVSVEDKKANSEICIICLCLERTEIFCMFVPHKKLILNKICHYTDGFFNKYLRPFCKQVNT